MALAVQMNGLGFWLWGAMYSSMSEINSCPWGFAGDLLPEDQPLGVAVTPALCRAPGTGVFHQAHSSGAQLL